MKRSMNLRMNRMNTSSLRAICAVIGMLAMASPSLAQQKIAPAPQPAPMSSQLPVASQPSVAPQVVPPAAQATSPALVASPVQAPAAVSPAVVPAVPPIKASDAVATAADGDVSRSVKSTVATPHELSPWSMFMSADVVVKAVMIGLAFASLVTWTVFIAKMIELSVIQRKLRAALVKIGDAR
jgi:biopolymer transport protein ExbB